MFMEEWIIDIFVKGFGELVQVWWWDLQTLIGQKNPRYEVHKRVDLDK